MMRGPKVTLTLWRYTMQDDAGGARVKVWEAKRRIRGTLTFIGGDERTRDSKETLYATHQFWVDYPKGLNITERDEFSSEGNRHRYKILFSDDILEQKTLLKINLLQIK